MNPAAPASFADFAVARRMQLVASAVQAGDAARALQLADAALRHAARLPLDCGMVQRIADVVVTLEHELAARLPDPGPPPPPSPPSAA